MIKVARDAEAVLQNVNPHSIAHRSPRGLPRKNTLARHLATVPNATVAREQNQGEIRTGIRATPDNQDVWEIN